MKVIGINHIVRIGKPEYYLYYLGEDADMGVKPVTEVYTRDLFSGVEVGDNVVPELSFYEGQLRIKSLRLEVADGR